MWRSNTSSPRQLTSAFLLGKCGSQRRSAIRSFLAHGRAEAAAAEGGVGAAAAAAVVTVVVQCMDSLDGADTLEAVNDVETKFRLHCPEVSARWRASQAIASQPL